MQVSVQFSGDKGGGILASLVASGILAAELLNPDGSALALGGASIGDAVGGGLPNVVLFLDGSGNLAQDAGFQFYILAPQYFQLTINGTGGSGAANLEVETDNYAAILTSNEATRQGGVVFIAGAESAYLGFSGANLNPNDTWGVFSGSNALITWLASGTDITLPSLAGTGTRIVSADSTGKLEATGTTIFSFPVLLLPEEASPPSTPDGYGQIRTEDAGGGKTRLVVQFHTGSAQVLATEP